MLALERFLNKIDVKENGCWEWTSHKSHKGYGEFWFKGKTIRAHRYIYEIYKAIIPRGKELDHLCRNILCVNPDHLELVTHRENILRGKNPPAMKARQTHCIHGHPFDLFNTYYNKGNRQCKQCLLNTNRKRRDKKECQG